jgi:hypothetical protein
VSKAARLRRKRGLWLIQSHERIEIARVDSINDRFQDLLRRSSRHDGLLSLRLRANVQKPLPIGMVG